MKVSKDLIRHYELMNNANVRVINLHNENAYNEVIHNIYIQ